MFEDRLACECGKRRWDAYQARTRDDMEKFMSGFYLQNNTTPRNCVSVRCRHSGFVIKHETGDFKMCDCTDFESGYSLDIEYMGGGWVCEGFTSAGSGDSGVGGSGAGGTTAPGGTGGGAEEQGGCGCATAGSGASSVALIGAALALVIAAAKCRWRGGT
jgi:hypothetical protein